jgi:hypothetical protein
MSVGTKEIEKATTYLEKMRDCYRKIDDEARPKNQYIFLSNTIMAILYLNIGMLERSNMILFSIMQDQLEYVQNDKDHPFLEQTYMHLAILYRSLKQF